MTYKYFIFIKKLADGKDAYREYCAVSVPFWKSMPTVLKDQYVDETFCLRYTMR